MGEPSPEDLEAVFGAPGGDAGMPPLPPNNDEMGGDEETEAALDAAIDEAFDSEDPLARREAFKRAMRLCNESQY